MKTKIKNFIDYFKYLDNPISALKFKFKFTDNCELKIKQNSIHINSISVLDTIMRRIPLVTENKFEEFIQYITELSNDEPIVTINSIKYQNIVNSDFINRNPSIEFNTCIEEYFSDGEWDMINFNNRHVIDIGGNVADTALDFAKNGAEVLSFEPVKHLYKLGLENIELNPQLKNKITFINKGVGGKKGILEINNGSTKGYINNQDNYSVEVITIKDIINNYNFEPDILKMDCEGCEFEIVINEDLTMFKDIILEHHSKLTGKNYNIIINELKKQGFKIHTYPCTSSSLPFEDIGLIHAFK